jgi:hypothetical protein
MHEFLDAFGIINTFVKPENRPPLAPIALLHPPVHRSLTKSAALDAKSFQKSADLDRLLVIVGYRLNGDWVKVSQVLKQKYNLQMAPEDCLSRFVEIPADTLGGFIKSSSSSASSSSGSMSASAPSASTTSLSSITDDKDKSSLFEHTMLVDDVDDVTSSSRESPKSGAGGNIVQLRHVCSTVPGSCSSADFKNLVAHLLQSPSWDNSSLDVGIEYNCKVPPFIYCLG